MQECRRRRMLRPVDWWEPRALAPGSTRIMMARVRSRRLPVAGGGFRVLRLTVFDPVPLEPSATNRREQSRPRTWWQTAAEGGVTAS